MKNKREYFKLIYQLQSTSSMTRKRAMETLCSMEDIVGPITRRIFDSDEQIRSSAVEILSEFGFGEPANALLSLYEKGELGRKEAVKQLIPLFKIKMPAPQFAVIAACSAGLSEIFEEVAYVAIAHENVYVRRAAIEGLYKCNQEGFIEAFLLASSDEDYMVRKYAAVGLSENMITSQAHRLCNDENMEVRKEAKKAFACPGNPVNVRDPHRKVMENNPIYELPSCGSILLMKKKMYTLKD